MYSSEDLERFYFQYQTESMPKGISIGKHSISSEEYCMNRVTFTLQNIKNDYGVSLMYSADL